MLLFDELRNTHTIAFLNNNLMLLEFKSHAKALTV